MSNAMTTFVTEASALRHDPASAAVVVMLRGLKIHGTAQGVGELIEQGAPVFNAAVPMLSQLLKAEMAEPRSGQSLARSRQPGSQPTRTWPASNLPPARPMKP